MRKKNSKLKPRISRFYFSMMLKPICIALCCFISIVSYGQTTLSEDIVFRDTVYNLAFDSLKHDFGKINPETQSKYLLKHFKYIGTKLLSIVKAWTGDPHYICKYPKEELLPNKVYEFTVCFSHKGRLGKMHKQMGFDLSDGNRVFMLFKGEYILQNE